MRLHEVIEVYSSGDQYKEIEFVCHNSNFKDSTHAASQKELFLDLKKLQKEVNYAIFPYMQDFSDDAGAQTSLAVIILDTANVAKLESLILNLASKHTVEVDLYSYLNDSQVDNRIREFS